MGFYCSLFERIGQWRNNVVRKVFRQLKEVYLGNVCAEHTQPREMKFEKNEKSFNINCLFLSEILVIYRKSFILIIEIKNVAFEYIVPIQPAYRVAKWSFLKILINGDWNRQHIRMLRNVLGQPAFQQVKQKLMVTGLLVCLIFHCNPSLLWMKHWIFFAYFRCIYYCFYLIQLFISV